MGVARTRIIGCAGLAAAVAAGTYMLVFRRRCLTWGATPDEVTRPLPGDDLLATPDIVSTRAVTIDAPPSAIWPWLVQMGSDRGGAYTYDWIENLFGLGMHSASTVLPEFQDVKVGDAFPLGQGGPSSTSKSSIPNTHSSSDSTVRTGYGASTSCLRTARLGWSAETASPHPTHQLPNER